MKVARVESLSQSFTQCDLQTQTKNFFIFPNGDEGSGVLVHNSPSVAVASNFNGEAFVATKGLFAKTPRYATNEEDARRLFGHSEDFYTKMVALLNNAKALGIPEGQIWQGDLLFHRDTLQIDEVDGERVVSFHPNTLVYTVPLSDPLAKDIRQAEVGVAFHTRYVGTDFDNIKISFDVDISELNKIPAVFAVDANIPQQDGLLTEEETQALRTRANNAAVSARRLIPFLEELSQEDEIVLRLSVFANSLIRKYGRQFIEPGEYMEEFVEYVEQVYDKEIEKKKRPETQDRYRAQRDALIEKIEGMWPKLEQLIAVQKSIAELKDEIVSRLNQLGRFGTFVRTIDQGFIPTGQEGFVVSDAEGNIVKLVSRLEFSRNNWDKAILKGWMSDKRQQETIDIFLSRLFRERRGTEDNPEYVTVAQKVNDLIEPHGLQRRNFPTKKSGVFKTQVEAPPGVDRKDAAETFIDKEEQIIQDFYIPPGKQRPSVLINLDGTMVTLEFKDNPKTPNKLDARQTAAMEIAWARCMQAANAGIDYPSFEELAETFTLMDNDWYEGFKKGAELIDENLLDSEPYVFVRGNVIIDTNSSVQTSPNAIHALIDEAFVQRRDLFTRIGSKKDAWNPSDVYACKASRYQDVVDAWKQTASQATSIEDLNSFLVSLQQEKTLIGISLKKPGRTVKSEPVNMEQQASQSSETYTINAVRLAMSLPPTSTSLTMQITDSAGARYDASVRYFGETGKGSSFGAPTIIEVKERGARAQLGKVPIGIVKANAAEYDVTFLSKREALQEITTGFPITLQYAERVQRAFPESSITVQAISDLIEQAEQEFPQFFDIAKNSAEQAFMGRMNTAKTDKQRQKVQQSESYIRAQAVMQAYLKAAADPDTARTLTFISQLPHMITHLAVFAAAKNSQSLNKLIDDYIKGAKKVGTFNAPFIKVT